MLLHRKRKLTKSKSLRLPYSEVVSLPLESILNKISRYEADLSDSVVSFISSSSGYRITGYFSGNLIWTLLAIVLVMLKMINANKTFTISMN
jgi:hypothetical protein